MASIIFLLVVFLILAALLGTLATGLVRLLGLGILALFAAFVINMASSGRLPNIPFSNPFSPSAQQIPNTTETASPPAAGFNTAQPSSSNGGELGSTGSTTGDTAGSTTGGTSASFNTVPGGAAATGANANTTGGTRATSTSQPTSTRPGVPALW